MADDLIQRARDHYSREILDWDLLIELADELARKDAEIAALRAEVERITAERDGLRERIVDAPSADTYVETFEGGVPVIWLADSTLPTHYEGKRVALVALEE